MPTIEVKVVKGKRLVVGSITRPLRVTPMGRPGVVYKRKVYAIYVVGGAYTVDQLSEHWREDVHVCPIAREEEASQLLVALRQGELSSKSAHSDRTGKVATVLQLGAREDTELGSISSILELLSLSTRKPAPDSARGE